MDFKIWRDTVLTWINSLGLSTNISKFEQVKRNIVEEIIKIVEGGSDKSVIRFISEIFPNFTINEECLNNYKENDYLCLCTLILIYVCFSNKNELETTRRKMCSKLENSTQEYLTDFFVSIQDQGDVFSVNQKTIMDEISKFSQRNCLRNSASGDGIGTPVKALNVSLGCDSPLLEFLQTPKRKPEAKPRHTTCSYSSNDQLRKIKELTDQLVEEELEKASLHEKLKWHEVKCNDYEAKLKSKIKELEQLKSEWQEESSKNEKEIKKFQNTIEKSLEEKKKLSDELSYFENYVNILEKELSSVTSVKKSLEGQVKTALCKVEEYDREVKRLSEINAELEKVSKANEADLQVLKETYIYPYQNESLIESRLDESLDTTVTVPENMGVIIENLLKEKTSENETLQEAIAAMKAEKDSLEKEIDTLKSRLVAKENEHTQLTILNKELVSKIDGFVKTCKELKSAQNQLAEFSKLFNEKNVLDGLESKELHVIYDSSKEVTDSASQLSFDDNDTTHLTTITESLNEFDMSSLSESIASYDERKNALVQYQMEELNQEIITAKKSLIAFLRASMKNFEVLKIKENLINEMSKQHEHLENRITSLTELNKRLTKEILNSKNISEIDSEYREKELDNLRLEVESLKKASNLLKEKLADLEKANEMLVNKKDECMSELTFLREKNKSLNNDLQSRVMTQLKQQNSCMGFIRNKQETEMELERTLKLKDEIDKRFVMLRKIISNHDHKIHLEIMLSAAEQKFYVTSQNLLHVTYTCLKWSAKSLEHQCYLIGQGGDFTDEVASGSALKKEQEENREELKNILNLLNSVTEDLEAIEMKCNETPDLSDSLEVVSSSNKTFDIINLDEKCINDRTFSIRREDFKPVGSNITVVKESSVNSLRESNVKTHRESKFNVVKDVRVMRESNINVVKESKSAWVISPPSKAVRKAESKKSVSVSVKKEKPIHGESWVIPLSPPKSSQKNVTNDKSEADNSKSSSSVLIPEVEYSPPWKPELKKSTSVTSFISATDTVSSSEIPPTSDSSHMKKELQEMSVHHKDEETSESVREPRTESEFSIEMKIRLEEKVKKLQMEVIEAKKENERLRQQLAECEERRRQEKEFFDKRQEELKQSITNKYENQLEHLKAEMKTLYNIELAKHKAEQSKVNSEVREQNKIYKDHVDELRNQLWNLGEKLLHEQKMKRDLERNLEEMKKMMTRMSCSTELESRTSQDSDYAGRKDRVLEENFLKQLGSSSFPTIPTEDEDEVFDNRCLEDMKAGICRVEGSEGRLTELQYRNSLCLPHLKSSYPAETQFHNPKLFKENDLKYGSLNFGQESQSLTDSDHSMTRSLLPDDKGKRREQSSYKKPGPPTPSKNGGRLSIQSADFHVTPRKVLRENNDQADRKSTPGRIRSLFTMKTNKRDSIGYKDENAVPVASRGKKLKIFPSVKPFGGREY